MKQYVVFTVDKISGIAILKPTEFATLQEARQRAEEIQAHTEWGITWIYDKKKENGQSVEIYQ